MPPVKKLYPSRNLPVFLPHLQVSHSLICFKVDQRFILRRNCKVFMALQARGPKGFPEREDWENEFMRGWHRKWPVFWEGRACQSSGECLSLVSITLKLMICSAFFWVLLGLTIDSTLTYILVTSSIRTISTTIIWSIPLSQCPKPKPWGPICIKTNLVVLDGLLTTVDVMGCHITWLIGEKQEAAMPSMPSGSGTCSM